MFKHIATPRYGFAAEGIGAGTAPPGPAQNAAPMGQCFVDIAYGIGHAAMNNTPALAGALAGAALSGSPLGAVGPATTGMVNLGIAAVNAYQDSAACQNLDNAGLANELGISAIVAP